MRIRIEPIFVVETGKNNGKIFRRSCWYAHIKIICVSVVFIDTHFGLLLGLFFVFLRRLVVTVPLKHFQCPFFTAYLSKFREKSTKIDQLHESNKNSENHACWTQIEK